MDGCMDMCTYAYIYIYIHTYTYTKKDPGYQGDDWLFGMREALGGKEGKLQAEADEKCTII